MPIQNAWTEEKTGKSPAREGEFQAGGGRGDGGGGHETEAPPSWRDFTQNTTFHGIKYVFESESLILRRLFWSLTILGAIAFFVVQVGFRIRDYYDYQTVTSVKTVVTDELQFPAVTLCNLNNYRISVAYDLGLYEYFDEQLRNRDEALEHASLYGIDNTTNTVSELGHPLHQIIDSCTWSDEPCNMSLDFKSHLLDIGLCHTFNFDSSQIKTVTQEGVNGGLKLLLNIEEYEHMRGSNLDSGVKFLLHQPNSVPSLRNLGFVATPGQHTFVSIKMTQVIGQPPPWGSCTEDGTPVADCKHECFTEEFINNCRCADTSMLGGLQPETPVCNLSTKLTCGCDSNNKDSSTCGLQCSCSKPCMETFYRPTLSSSMLSSINLDMFALTDKEAHNRTNETFLGAREIRLRLSPEYAADVVRPVTQLLSSLGALNLTAHHYPLPAVPIPGNATYTELIQPLAAGFYQSSNDFDPVVLKQNQRDAMSGRECDVTVENVGRYLADLIELGYRLTLLVRLREAESYTGCPGEAAYHEVFTAGAAGNDTTCLSVHGQSLLIDEFCSAHCQEIKVWRSPEGQMSACDAAPALCVCCLAGEIQRKTPLYAPEIPNLAVHLTNSYTAYMNEFLFNIFHPLYEQDDGYCQAQATYYLTDTVIVPTILTNIAALFNHPFLPVSLLTFDQFVTDTVAVVGVPIEAQLNDVFRIPLDVACCWQTRLVQFDQTRRTILGSKETIESVVYERDVNEEATVRFQEMAVSDFNSEVQTVVLSKLLETLAAFDVYSRKLQNYLSDSSLSTRELSIGLLGPVMRRQAAAVVSETERLIDALIVCQRVLGRFQEHMRKFLELITVGMIVPLLSQAITYSKLNAFLLAPTTRDMLEQFTFDSCKQTDSSQTTFTLDIEILLEISCVFYKLVGDDITILTTAARDFDMTFDTFMEYLENYHTSTEMDENFYMTNFMQVDLYYEELEYELIEEQKAFVLVSLFSEIGGFLGLLLGASLLTVCELLDHLIIRFGPHVKKHKVNSKPDDTAE